MERVVVVGGGIAGVTAALSARDQNKKIEILLIEKEKYAGYSRGELPYIISEKYDRVTSRTEVLKQNEVRTYLSSFVKKIDVPNKKITFLASDMHERILDFTKLVIATGAIPVKLNVRGCNLNNIYELRTIDDAIKIKGNIVKKSKVVIVGGGLVAIETAEALLKRGCKIVMVFPEKEILYKVFDENFGKMLREKMEKKGIEIIPSNQVKAFYGKGKVEATEVDEGIIPCDFAILTLGVVPNTVLAREAGILLGKYNGIIVDERMKASAEDVYSAGDCVEHVDFVTKKRTPIQVAALAYQGGEVAGRNAAGGSEKIEKTISNICAKIFGYEIASVGITFRETKNFRKEVLSSYTVLGGNGYYRSREKTHVNLIFDGESRRLIGAQVIGRRAATWGNFLALAVIKEVNVEEMAYFCNSYSPSVEEVVAAVIVAAKRARELFS